MVGIAKWLGHCTLVPRVPGSKRPSDLSQSVRKEFASYQSFQVKRQNDHEVWSHREEGPGSHCSISLPIQWALCALRINQYLTKIVSVLYVPINYQCTASISLSIQWALCALHINPYLEKIVSVCAYQLSTSMHEAQNIRFISSVIN